MNEADDVDLRLILLREPALRKKVGDRAATLRMFYVVRLAITPISGPSFCAGYSNHMNSIVAATEDNLKWKLPHAARTMSIVNSNETFRIGLDACKRNVYGDTEIARLWGYVPRTNPQKLPTRRSLRDEN